MKKTIQDIERMALLYMEEEIFEFEQALVKSNEARSEKSKTISQLTGYELYIDHMIENSAVDYSFLREEVRLFVGRYDKCSIEDIDTSSTYYNMLESRIAHGKLKAIGEMYHLYFGTGAYNYKLLDCEVDSFIISHGFAQYNEYRSWAKKTNVEVLVRAVNLYELKNTKRSVNDLVHDEVFYNDLKLVPMSKDGNDCPRPATLNNYYSEYKKTINKSFAVL